MSYGMVRMRPGIHAMCAARATYDRPLTGSVDESPGIGRSSRFLWTTDPSGVPVPHPALVGRPHLRDLNTPR
ncbi:hypothetical protein CLV30_101220 [Haloactinopolyspora alba]|uniref:Uncharacterized protein n=1 Tax=Haloactinopolyspora alba TaxID=648780 RepID=A0A2P8EFK3_9ACTN|nr:hypothetical protein CLV30_101220 [Haloactinopolyspora alba]